MLIRERYVRHGAWLRLGVVLCLVLLAAAFLPGCAVGPDYVPPETDMPENWTEPADTLLSPLGTPETAWWIALGDTVLIELIWRAEQANLDLATALARIDEARAQRGISKSDFWPQVRLGGTYTRSQLSEQGTLGQLLPEGERDVPPRNVWDLGFDAAWELDLFGGIRRGVEASSAELAATVEDYRDVLISLQAEVAASYIEVRSLQTRIAFAQQNARAQRGTLGLTQDRFDAGLTSALDVAQALSNLANTQAQIPTLDVALTAALNRLAVLLGEYPGALHAELAEPVPILDPPDSLTVGMPGDLLLRRPDVRRAERQLAAQTARIGVATADLYPRFSISGFFGRQAVDFDDLGQGSSTTWNIIPGFVWDLFTGGKLRKRIAVEEARTDQALYQYEQAVLRALEEVENAMVAYQRERMRRDRLQQAVTATERSVNLVHTQYLSGLTNFQNYLDAQRSLFNQQDQLAESEGLVVKNLIALNKALGGGWEISSDAADNPVAATTSASTGGVDEQ